ncbi:homocitrate synthase/isopropylmalate synthase family protein [Clostridium hydrogenum]|uniref:homocitrate synthase/isopropylmalate synthase family protein n=1 Tax=Clostridium hydrogenum TaxID=2855764 RepID=UPI001F3CF318|nr:homocitrate synthase [Clostridium hydrogenum]
MAVIVNGKKKFIIDRSIPEIVRKLDILEKKDLVEYVDLLAAIGVDIIEIDIRSINQIGNFHKNIIYAVRVEAEEDIGQIKDYNFRYVIMNCNLARNMKNYVIAKMNNWKIILEIDIETINDDFLNENYEILNNFNIASIRFNNVKKYNFNSWSKFIKNIKNEFSVLIDFCPQNEYFAATAIAIEGCLDGADFITTAFNGEKYGFAALEEVMLALKVINSGEFTGNLKLISKIKIIYEKLVNQKIFAMKPILGDDIFKYESGIHVDGIEKNEKTYEPYSPCEIGAERQMFIGKHSGKKAVVTKLAQLNLNPNKIDVDELLRNIRSKSVNLRRNILDKELIKLYANMTNKI